MITRTHLNTLLLSLATFCLFAITFILPQVSFGQQDNIMIVEYVDWDSQDGAAIKLFNPTDSPINLSNYEIVRYGNGNPTHDSQAQLYGILAPKAFVVFGNSRYCNVECPTDCNEVTLKGVNGNDALAILDGNTGAIIDHVGPYGIDIDLTIDGSSNALDQKKIVRNLENCTRYYNLSGNPNNAWPDNDQQNVTTWSVEVVSCLDPDVHSFALPMASIPADTTFCDTTSFVLDISYLNADSYNWLDLGLTSSSINVSQEGNYIVEIGFGTCTVLDTFIATSNCDSIIVVPPPPPEPVDSVFIPNIITPNNDMVNDVFVFTGMIRDFPVSLKVYNRWGKVVYQSDDYDQSWTADNVTDGMYFYEIQDVVNTYSGWLSVRR